jgi:hypothetical protein
MVELAVELNLASAVLYNQLLFWSDKGGREDGWVYKSYADLQKELGLTERQLRGAYQALEDAGYIETKVMKYRGTPTKHFRYLQNVSSHTDKMSVSETNKMSVSINTEKTTEDIVEKNEDKDMNKNVQGIIKLRRQLKWKTPFIGAKREGEIAQRLAAEEGYAEVIKLMKLYEQHRGEPFLPAVNNLGDFEQKFPSLKTKLEEADYERQPL